MDVLLLTGRNLLVKISEGCWPGNVALAAREGLAMADQLSAHPIHLGVGATAEPQPKFTGEMDWYQSYGERHGADGVDGRLVSMHSFGLGTEHRPR